MSHVSQSFTCLKNILFFGQPAHYQESHLDLRRNIPGTKRLRQSNIDETDGDQHQLKQDLDNVNHLASLDLQPNFWGLGMACQGKNGQIYRHFLPIIYHTVLCRGFSAMLFQASKEKQQSNPDCHGNTTHGKTAATELPILILKILTILSYKSSSRRKTCSNKSKIRNVSLSRFAKT